jgi:hypothetical protein
MSKKSLFGSKTFWANVLGIVAVVGSGQAGIAIPHAPEVLAVANILLRVVTKQGVYLPGR